MKIPMLQLTKMRKIKELISSSLIFFSSKINEICMIKILLSGDSFSRVELRARIRRGFIAGRSN